MIFKNWKKIKLLGYSGGNTDYEKAKEAIEKGWPALKEQQNWIKQGGWVGVVVPDGFIVIDIDNKEKGKIIYYGLRRAGYHFLAIETPRGYQFIFYDTGRVKSQSSKRLTLGGIVVDYRLPEKGYIILPTINTEERIVIYNPDGRLSSFPLFFLPVRGIKETDEELGKIPDGTRNTTLISHASKIREWNVAHRLNLTLEDKREALDEINSLLCYPPLEEEKIDTIFKSTESYPTISTPSRTVTDVTDVTVESSIIDSALIPLYPFPIDVFPQQLQLLIKKISDALHVEREIVACAMLTITSGAIGNSIRVSPKQGYEVALFIWLIIIALSGYGKSPVIQTLLKHIKQQQAKAYQRYQSEMKIYESQMRKAKADVEIDVPEKPRLKHQYVSDCTVEALAGVFECDGRGVIHYQDEIAGLILGLDQYKGKGNDQQHYNELFNCGSWKIDRKAGVKFIHNTGAAIIGGIQPKVMPLVFNTNFFDDGLLPRFLFLHSEDKPLKFSRQAITEEDLSYWIELLNWCYAIPCNQDEDGFIKPKVLILSSKALDLWEGFYNDYGSKTPFLSERARVFIPKLIAYYSLKFAGVLHAIKAFDKGTPIGSLIEAETIQHAIELTHFFAGQAIKTLQLYEQKETLTEYQKRLIETLQALQGEVKNGKLQLSKIVDVFNEGLPEAIRHTPHRISAMLKRLELTTEKGSHNLSFLQWEPEKIQKIFSKVTVTNVTKVTREDVLKTEKVTKVTNVTFIPENEVIEVLEVSE